MNGQQDPNCEGCARLAAAESTVERVRALADEWETNGENPHTDDDMDIGWASDRLPGRARPGRRERVVSIAWICATDGNQEAFNTEREAESRARQIVQSTPATVAAVYPVEVES